MDVAHHATWRFGTTRRGLVDVVKDATPAIAGAAETWKTVVQAEMAARSTDTSVKIVDQVIRTARTIARLAVRRIGAATAIAIRTATWITARAFAITGNAGQDASSVLAAVALTTIAAAARGPAANAARSAAAAHRVTRITTSIPVRRWPRPRIRTTRCVVREISCSAIRPALVDIDSGGKAEGGRGLVPLSPFAFVETLRVACHSQPV